MDERLSYGWLIRQLMLEGTQTDKSELSLFLSGKRQTPKAENTLKQAEVILDRYRKYFSTRRAGR